MGTERNVLDLVTQARGIAEAHALDVNGDMDDAVLHLRLAERALRSAALLPSAVVQPGSLPAGEDRMYSDLDHGSRALAGAEEAIVPLRIAVTEEDRERSRALDVDTGFVADHLSRARRVFEEWIAEVSDLGAGLVLTDGWDDGTPSLRNRA